MDRRKRVSNVYAGKRRLHIYRPDEISRKVIEGNLEIDYKCFRKSKSEREFLKFIKANCDGTITR